MAWHRGSQYPHRTQFQPLTREERARWRFLINTARSQKKISAVTHDVATALLQRLGESGQCDPSHATLAKDARCSERAVRYALERLRACGLLDWTRRILRTKEGARQTSSAFRLLLATLAVLAGFTPPRPDGNASQRTQTYISQEEKKAPRSDLEAAQRMAAEATRSLAQIARDRMAAIYGRKMA